MEDDESVLDYAEQVNQSKAYIEKIASNLDESYENLMNAADLWVLSSNNGGWGNYWSKPKFEGEGIPKEFWRHYEIVTGKEVEERSKSSFLTCSCG
jgi:hypothetical protein